jgi:hypothetical protein
MSPTSIIDSAKQKDKQQPLLLFFCSTADTWSKWPIFLAIPMNTALYGAESWTLNV